MEEMLDAFADRISKPRLSLTDKMLISLGKLLWYKMQYHVSLLSNVYKLEWISEMLGLGGP